MEHPDHGEIEIPEDWVFLPSGDVFVTRRVTAAGIFWVAWRPRGRNRPHRRRLGLWAPNETIEAAEVGSGRVGRTRMLSVEERASLAARALIRHRYTSYEADLFDASMGEPWDEEFWYREIKAEAQSAVDGESRDGESQAPQGITRLRGWDLNLLSRPESRPIGPKRRPNPSREAEDNGSEASDSESTNGLTVRSTTTLWPGAMPENAYPARVSSVHGFSTPFTSFG